MRRNKEWRKRGVFIPEESKDIKKLTCRVCGKTFYPKANYIARGRLVSGGIAGALSGNSSDPEIYDAMDCPECGCQMVLKERLREDKTCTDT